MKTNNICTAKFSETVERNLTGIMRLDLSMFIAAAFRELNPETEYFPSDHIDVIAAKLSACQRGEIRRLIISLPPRSLKSHSVSVAFVAWLLGLDPAKQVICASYGQDLAEKHARDCRTVMMTPFYRRVFPETRISSQRSSVNDFMTTKNGFRMATSVGGVLTGRGGDIIVIDDPLKPDEALSETKRKAVNDWFDNSLLSRLNNKTTGTIIIVMQRLHQDDLVGHVMEKGEWEVLNFPAIAEEDEIHLIHSPFGAWSYTRKKGEVLSPIREPLETLRQTREDIGEYNFSSQYQQNPVPLDGARIKTAWLKYYEPKDLPERFPMVVQSWDTANKSGEFNDYSVCTVWGIDRKNKYLLEVFRERLDYPELRRAVKNLSEKCRRQYYSRPVVLIEDKASGTQLLQDLKADQILRLKSYSAPAGSDKVMRLFAQTTEFECGHVFFPRSAPWLTDYVKELTTFPGSKYDDQVDSTTQALDYVKSRLKYLKYTSSTSVEPIFLPGVGLIWR